MCKFTYKAVIRLIITIVNSKNKLFTPRNDGNSVNTKEQQRLQALLNLGLQQSEMIPVFEEAAQTAAQLSANISREKLGLLLSCHLAELHHGQISIQGSVESGYRYIVSLPLKFATSSANPGKL